MMAITRTAFVISRRVGPRLHAMALLMLLSAVCVVTSAVAQSPTTEPHEIRERAAFEAFAAEILDRLRGADGLHVAIWPFDEARVPISSERASEFNDRLLVALVQRGDQGLVYLEAGELCVAIEEFTQTSDCKDVDNPVATLVRSPKVDILVIGKMRRIVDSEDVRLQYRAVRVRGAGAGETIAATQFRRIGNPDRVERPTFSLDQAAKTAASHFSEHASDMREVKTGGIQFQTSGVRTDLAAFIEDAVEGALMNAFSNRITERALIVSPLGLGADRLASLDGAQESNDSLRPQNFDPRLGVYALTGSYWEFPSSIDLRLRLRDAQGRSFSWRGHVRKSDLPPDLRVGLPGDFGLLTENHQGAINFQLLSNHGRDPAAYEIGERLHLLIRTSTDAWVYCFYLQANRVLFKIFPNYRYDNPHLKGGIVHKVPGRIFPFNLDIQAPAGIELVKCFAASRDITDELPPDLRSNAFEPLSKRRRFDLARIFRRIPNVAMTEASLVITVNERTRD